MKKITYNVYDFNELNNNAKQTAIDKWYELEDYPYLEENLTESLKCYIDDTNWVHCVDAPKLGYSLSYCQGDGLHFIGTFECFKKRVIITHTWRYEFCGSETMDFEEENDVKWTQIEINQFKEWYKDICNKLEKEGYAELEYRMSFDEFAEHCEANEYTFTEAGIMDNSK